jgi:hypothetical protein
VYELIKKSYETITSEPALGLVKQLTSVGVEFFTKKRDERLMQFYQNLLDVEVTQERIDYEKENIKANEEQYFILLNLSITDEDKEKTYIYSNVYRYIRDNQGLNKNIKTKYIRLAKNLPFSVLELIPLIYIYNKYKKTKTKTLNQFLEEIEKSNKFETNLLIQYDILINEKNIIRDESEATFTINETFLNEIVNALFKEEHLLPSFYGIEIWEKNSFLFIEINGESDRLNSYLSNLLSRNLIKLSENLNIFALSEYKLLTQENIICVLNKNKIDISIIEILKRYSKTHNIVKICFEENIDDQLSEIKGDLIYLKRNDEDYEKLFISKFV